MQKQKLRNNKIKRTNTKNMPMFILIGLIAMIIIIALIYYVFLRYSPEQIITYSGYAIEGKTMAENLKSSEISNIEQYLNLIEVKENDLLYKRLNSYYIGEDDKKEVDINYPMYINEGSTIFNISRNTKLITVNYEEVEGYPEFMLTGGVMYNGGDLTRADGNKYIFLKSEDEIYTNVDKIKVKTATNEYEIKEYSNIYFTEEAIAYYEMQDGYMEYKRIVDIDNNSEITINGETLTYKTFLEKLRVIQLDEQNINNNKDEEVNEIEENSTIDNETSTEEENNNNNNANETEEWQEGMWAKPEVSCTDFEAEVYTIKTNLSVEDKAGVITRGVIFEISLDGRLNRRVQATQTGELEITGLQPDTTYEIVGIVYYNDENGNEVEEEFYTGTVTTKSIDTLGTIDFSFQNGTVYPNKIELIHLKINNDINEEVIKGISRLQLEIGGIEYRLSNDQVNRIKAGEEITYQTSETLTSNSTIKYEITAFDKFGNELKEINNTGETITSKQAPSSSIRATKQDVTEVDLEVTLTNKDNVLLENYRYEITNQSGDKVKEGTLTKDTETLVFTDLDPNGYYQIIIYGDYDLENGDGKQINQELGRGSFVTRPIASLGYMQVRIDDKEVLQNTMNLGISIDSNQTDARLIAILDKVEVVIYDEGKNVNQDNSDTEEQINNEIKRITLSKEEVELLKTAEEVEIELDQLNSNTKYRIDVITTVKQGSVEEVVEDKQNLSEVITLKMPAEVQIRNQFVIGDMIDLDIRVEDIDNAVLTQNVRIEVRDEENKLVNLSEMATNADYERKVYEGLEPETTYRIIIYAPQYNIGSTDKTYEADYILKEIEILTEAGISGKLDLLSLEKTPAGKNLIDVASKVNWYEKCFGTENRYGLKYDINTNILTLGETYGNNRLNYYDLSKYIGQEVTISFKAKTSDTTNMYIIEKYSEDFNNLDYLSYYNINNLNNEWKEYNYTVKLNRTGYIGFYVNTNATVEIQDLQIELGNTKTSYEEFKYTYNTNVIVSVNDVRNEITTNDYYIRIYKNGEQIQEFRYEELSNENKVENIIKSYEVNPDAIYEIELLVKVQDRYYELDSQEFTTQGLKEIKGITSLNDFLKIQPYGEYIVLENLDFSGVSGNDYRFGNGYIEFEGKINFNGKIVTKDSSTRSPIFRVIGSNGIVENLVLDIIINNEIGFQQYQALIYSNNGTIRNIQINITQKTKVANGFYMLMGYTNYGKIENFIINFKQSLYIDGNNVGSVFVPENFGTVANGYVYGKNIEIIPGSSNSVGIVVNRNRRNGIVKNIYNLVSADISEDELTKLVGNIVYENNDNAIVENVYSVEIGENTTIFSHGPNVYAKNSKRVYNNYYFMDEIFTSELEIKGNKLSLWDSEFQNQIINNEGRFIVDELVNEGYYPHLDMPDCMPDQEYIELPEVADRDLPDILSTKIIEQGTNTVKVEFSVNNPSAETISDIKIENIEVEIISQEYKDGKSAVIVELKNPTICVSSYNVLSISTKGAFNSSYTRKYEKGERVIYVDLYNEVWSINDWKSIANSNTENYMLMTDLDFINEGNTIQIARMDGILNGNNHEISNIKLTNNYGLISEVYGEVKNLNIKQIELIDQTNNNYTASIINSLNNGSMDNIHIQDMRILRNSLNTTYRIGGIVSLATKSTIKNSSVTNLSIIENTEEHVENQYIGGIVGLGNSATIENCYVQNLKIEVSETVNNYIGGIIGYGGSYGIIENCYVQGNIYTENGNVGGIAGVSAGIVVENCYSIINISSQGLNIGGILGNALSNDYLLSNNLSIGNLYTTQGIGKLNRIIGNNSEQGNNYAYKKQLINGFVNNEEKGAILLTKNEILNLYLGDYYDYDKGKEGILPKLYNTDGKELLPNQEDIFLDNSIDGEIVDLEVESIETEKPNTTEAEITIRIKNPEEIEITGIAIEDMSSTVIKNVTQNGITDITVRGTPERYYDSYKLTEIRYKSENIEEEQIKEVEAEIEVQFYKEIYTYEDWQAIEEGTYQNYRLMADIDFTGRDNVKNNITVNRIEAENNIYKLKNIELEFVNSYTGLIKSIRTSIKNIGFENITIRNIASGGNYNGVIATCYGDVENLTFENVTIDAEKMNYVGVIGFIGSGNVKNITLDTVSIIGTSYVGGLSGRFDYEISNINANNVDIKGTGDMIGGIVGYTSNAISPRHINIKISNSNIIGYNYVGGITGYNYEVILTNSSVDGSVIEGESFIGGMTGYKYVTSEKCYYNSVSDCEIYGEGSYIGGLTGHSTSYEYYANVNNSKIYGTSLGSLYVGGVSR